MEEPIADVEHHFTVLVRLPFKRGDFADPPAVAWSASKERDLWKIISQPSKGNDIDWNSLAGQFQVSPQFLLQQAAWLYERQLSQVRTQIRRMGTNQSNSPSPVPNSMAGSSFGTQLPRRTESSSSRAPSGLSIRQRESPAPMSEGEGLRPAKGKSSGLTRQASLNATSNLRTESGLRSSPKPADRELVSTSPSQATKEDRPSPPLSPTVQDSSSEDSSDDDDEAEQHQAIKSRRHQLHPRRRRGTQRSESFRTVPSAPGDDEDDDDGSDSSPFLPFAAAANLPKSSSSATHVQDPGATLRGDPRGISRPNMIRRTTSERLSSSPTTPISTRFSDEPAVSSPGTRREALSTIESSLTTSSGSSTTNPAPNQPAALQSQRRTTHPSAPTSTGRTGNALSPRQAAALTAAGLSPRLHRGNSNTAAGQTSDGTGTPSMGSSFSDLDDTSVTQSALEEALLSNMQRQGNGNGNGGQGVASRMSSISQALRSRYL